MDCCSRAKCHCDLSAPAQPTPVPAPARAADFTGHDLTKIAPVHMSATLLLANGQFSTRSADHVAAQHSTAVALYSFTHAFLI
jgi:hypothetical protein